MVTSKQKPTWSIISTFWASVFILALSSLLTFVLLHKPVWFELEITVLVISICTFCFYFLILFTGVRFNKHEKYVINFKPFEIPSWAQHVDFGSVPDVGIDLGDNLVGAIVGLIVGILFSILIVLLLSVLIWLGANVIVTGIPVLFLPLYMVYRRSVRYAVVHGRRSYKSIWRSALYSLRATVLNIGWLYVVIYLSYLVSTYFFHARIIP